MEKQYTELQLKHQREMRAKREAVKQRKNRTHRLIVRGALAESILHNAENMTDEEFRQALLEAINEKE